MIQAVTPSRGTGRVPTLIAARLPTPRQVATTLGHLESSGAVSDTRREPRPHRPAAGLQGGDGWTCKG